MTAHWKYDLLGIKDPFDLSGKTGNVYTYDDLRNFLETIHIRDKLLYTESISVAAMSTGHHHMHDPVLPEDREPLPSAESYRPKIVDISSRLDAETEKMESMFINKQLGKWNPSDTIAECLADSESRMRKAYQDEKLGSQEKKNIIGDFYSKYSQAYMLGITNIFVNPDSFNVVDVYSDPDLHQHYPVNRVRVIHMYRILHSPSFYTYVAASIRGGRDLEDLPVIGNAARKRSKILTEHVLNPSLTSQGETIGDYFVMGRDVNLAFFSDVVIEHLGPPSFGEGKEDGIFFMLAKFFDNDHSECYCADGRLYSYRKGTKLSALASGDVIAQRLEYENQNQLAKGIDSFLARKIEDREWFRRERAPLFKNQFLAYLDYYGGDINLVPYNPLVYP